MQSFRMFYLHLSCNLSKLLFFLLHVFGVYLLNLGMYHPTTLALYRDWETIDDMHKPALDGIGYQDSVNTGRAWWDDTYLDSVGTLQKHAAGKTVAWIDYMTNVNRTYGNFASGMSEAFMVLNRNYQMKIGKHHYISSHKCLL